LEVKQKVKKKLLFIGLVTMLVLAFSMPSAALAKAPAAINAGGVITSIDDGTVFPAGNSGRYVVAARTITGTLAGDISGDFTLNYKANVELATQAGNLHGTLVAGSQVLEVNGNIQPLQAYAGNLYTFLGVFTVPGFGPLPFYYVPGVGATPLFDLEISGHWTATSGAKGNGNFTASVIFIPTADGHVAFVVPGSQLSMSGK
jgi:hypothetical protein